MGSYTIAMPEEQRQAVAKLCVRLYVSFGIRKLSISRHEPQDIWHIEFEDKQREKRSFACNSDTPALAPDNVIAIREGGEAVGPFSTWDEATEWVRDRLGKERWYEESSAWSFHRLDSPEIVDEHASFLQELRDSDND